MSPEKSPQQVVTVRSKRLVPTVKYGNQEWEILVTRVGDDLIAGQEVFELHEMINSYLDLWERDITDALYSG